MNKPVIVTLGDPAGVGPEVAAKVIADRAKTPTVPTPLVFVGSTWGLRKGAEAAGVALPALPVVTDLDAAGPGMSLLDPDTQTGGPPNSFEFGCVDAECGRLAVLAVEFAAKSCIDGSAAAMVTCPINKEAIHAAGFVNDIGHQEILARMTGAEWTATMLMTPGLKVVHLSTHKSLIEAARYVRKDTVLEKLNLMQRTLTGWGLAAPRIAVAALNPHGGEGGLLGSEEIEELAPAVAAARQQGIDATGPIPADSVFNRAIDGEFDVVLALYHDQGHIAIKVHDFHQSTTATLGIPFIRTSVDHGTAFDIAGQGKADPRGLHAAMDAAEALVAGELGRL
jgi:4-hydroxythreonine-4-phosphate dehydrogenase